MDSSIEGGHSYCSMRYNPGIRRTFGGGNNIRAVHSKKGRKRGKLKNPWSTWTFEEEEGRNQGNQSTRWQTLEPHLGLLIGQHLWGLYPPVPVPLIDLQRPFIHSSTKTVRFRASPTR